MSWRTRCPLPGDVVIAHSLAKAANWNGLEGKVAGYQSGRVGVDFGFPRGSRALQLENLNVITTPKEAPKEPKNEAPKEEEPKKQASKEEDMQAPIGVVASER